MSISYKLFQKYFTDNIGQQIRFLPRWSHRRPAKVILSENYDAVNDREIKPKISQHEESSNVESNQSITQSFFKNGTVQFSNNRKYDSLSKKNKPSSNLEPLTITKKRKTVDMLETIIDGNGNFIYTKMKDNDPRISNILVDLKSKKEKQKKDLILLEGKRLIKDALDAGCKLEYILFSRLKEIEYLKASLPKMGSKLYKMSYREMQLWSDLTTNPGIMGIFRIPDVETFEPPLDDTLQITIICDNVRESNNLGAILRTCSGAGSQDVILTKGCANLWDTKVLRAACGAHFKMRIKIKQDWEEIRNNLPRNSEIFVADNRLLSTTSSTDTPDTSNVESLPVLPYYSYDFTNTEHIVLIIGGETEGISEESYRLAAEKKGVRLNVPLSNHVESLNTGTALGIIVFEMKKQQLKKQQHNIMQNNILKNF